MEFNEKLMSETKELMNNCLGKLKEASEIFQMLQNDSEHLKVTEDLAEVDDRIYEEEYQKNCNCCKPSYPCDCKKCDELYCLADKKYALSVYAFYQSFETAKLALHQLEDAIDYYGDAFKYYGKAIYCSKKNHCDDFCKKCPPGCWHSTSCICRD